MAMELEDYEARKEAIRARKAARTSSSAERFDDFQLEPQGVGVGDVLKIGSKVVIGGGVGLLAGMAAIAVTASAGEIILAGVVTKIAGVVGGALGLTMGLGSINKNKRLSGSGHGR